MPNTQQWLDLPETSNRYIRTYVNGFVDISGGNLFLRGGSGAPADNNCHLFINNGDISLNGRLYASGDVSINSRLTVGLDASFNSRLFVGGDVSLNSRLLVGSDTIIYGRLFVNEYQNQYIINTIINNTTTNYTLIIAQDISINGNLYLLKDASINNRLFVGGDVSLNSRLIVISDVSLSSRLFVGGDVSFNSRLIVVSDVSLSSRLFVGGDVSMNSRLTVINDVSLNRRLFVGGDVSFNSRLTVYNDVSLNNRLFVGCDVSLNSRLTVYSDVSFNNRLFVGGDVSLNSRLIVYSDASFNSRLFVGGDVSLNSRLVVYSDVSFNNRLFIGADVSLNGNLFVASNVGLGVSGSVYRIDVSGITNFRGPVYPLTLIDDSVLLTNNSDFDFSGNFGTIWNINPVQPVVVGSLYTSIAISSTGQYQLVSVYANTPSVGNKNGTLYLSNNFGAKWIQLLPANGIPDVATNPTLVVYPFYSVAMSSTGQYQTAVLYNVAIPNGAFKIYKSSNYGVDWTSIQINSVDVNSAYCVAMSATGQYQVFIQNYSSTYINAYISTNYGSTWTPNFSGAYLNCVAISSTGQYIIITQSSISPSVTGYIYVSNNFGNSFSSTTIGSTAQSWYCCAISSSGKYQYACIYNGKIYISINYGVIFTVLTNSPSGAWKSIAVSANGQYIAACVNGGGIYTSNNFGNSWTLSNSGNDNWTCMAMSSDAKYIVSCAGVPGSATVGNIYTSVTPISNITISNGLTVYSDVSFNNRLFLSSDATITGTLTVKGAGTALTVDNNATITGTLTVTGNATIGNVTATSFNATSDYRVKTNVSDLPTLYTIDDIRPVEYISIKDNTKNLGVIAHELQELYPCLVSGQKDGEEMQSVNYIGIIPLLISEVKSLKKIVKQIQQEIMKV